MWEKKFKGLLLILPWAPAAATTETAAGIVGRAATTAGAKIATTTAPATPAASAHATASAVHAVTTRASASTTAAATGMARSAQIVLHINLVRKDLQFFLYQLYCIPFKPLY